MAYECGGGHKRPALGAQAAEGGAQAPETFLRRPREACPLCAWVRGKLTAESAKAATYLAGQRLIRGPTPRRPVCKSLHLCAPDGRCRRGLGGTAPNRSNSAGSGERNPDLGRVLPDIRPAFVVFGRRFEMLQHQRRIHRQGGNVAQVCFVIDYAAPRNDLEEVHV